MYIIWETASTVLNYDLDHCIDYLRQVLMCHGDIGIITFRYGRNGRSYKPNFNVTRTCRKFEPLAQWSDLHQSGNATPDGSENDWNFLCTTVDGWSCQERIQEINNATVWFPWCVFCGGILHDVLPVIAQSIEMWLAGQGALPIILMQASGEDDLLMLTIIDYHCVCRLEALHNPRDHAVSFVLLVERNVTLKLDWNVGMYLLNQVIADAEGLAMMVLQLRMNWLIFLSSKLW